MDAIAEIFSTVIGNTSEFPNHCIWKSVQVDRYESRDDAELLAALSCSYSSKACDLSEAAASARALEPLLVGRIEGISDLRPEPALCKDGATSVLGHATMDVDAGVFRLALDDDELDC